MRNNGRTVLRSELKELEAKSAGRLQVHVSPQAFALYSRKRINQLDQPSHSTC
jgi:hypothetical protein